MEEEYKPTIRTIRSKSPEKERAWQKKARGMLDLDKEVRKLEAKHKTAEKKHAGQIKWLKDKKRRVRTKHQKNKDFLVQKKEDIALSKKTIANLEKADTALLSELMSGKTMDTQKLLESQKNAIEIDNLKSKYTDKVEDVEQKIIDEEEKHLTELQDIDAKIRAKEVDHAQNLEEIGYHARKKDLFNIKEEAINRGIVTALQELHGIDIDDNDIDKMHGAHRLNPEQMEDLKLKYAAEIDTDKMGKPQIKKIGDLLKKLFSTRVQY